jgi:hypothetical protein
MPDEVSALANLIDPAAARDDVDRWNIIANQYP